MGLRFEELGRVLFESGKFLRGRLFGGYDPRERGRGPTAGGVGFSSLSKPMPTRLFG